MINILVYFYFNSSINFDFLVKEVNAQWRNLKDVFHKNKHNMLKLAKSGQPLRDPTWKFYQPLKFLLKAEKIRSLTKKR